MTWKILFFLATVSISIYSSAPFIELNTVHQAYSEFELNLIFNQNRNHALVIVTVSNDDYKSAVTGVLENAFDLQADAAFGILLDCRQFNYNLNRTLGVCQHYKPDQVTEQGTDPNFYCQFLKPFEAKIRVKGHALMKNHAIEHVDGSNFNAQFLAEMIKQNVADFVSYIQDQYDYEEFLQISSQFKAARKPKLVYFDQNLLSPPFLKKLAALLDGRMDVGVSDELNLLKEFSPSYEQFYLLEFDYSLLKYQTRQVSFNIDEPIKSILDDISVSQFRQVKKNRDILLDFEHASENIYNFDALNQIYNLQSHARIIVLQVSAQQGEYTCEDLAPIGKKYSTLFNYVCFSRSSIKLLIEGDYDNKFLFIVDSAQKSFWVDRTPGAILKALPQAISRQRVSTVTDADHCLRTAQITERYPIFFYFNEKAGEQKTFLVNYLNSLPEVTSLQYFCQVYLPDEDMKKKFGLKLDTIFTMYDPDKNGNMKKMEHSKISTFVEIKMFLREISLQKMLNIYHEKLINNQIVQIKNAQQFTSECFNKKCIVGLIATGRYREKEEIQMLKEVKLMFEDQFKFVWIDGICHWDIPRQMKILKKKQKVIDMSYVFYYDEKDTSFSLWKSKKFWDKKDLKKWVKSLRNSKTIGHLKFGLDLEERACEKKKDQGKKNEQL